MSGNGRRDLAVILAGAGEGLRMEGLGPKLLLEVEGRAMLARAAEAFLLHPATAEIVAVVPDPLLASARDALASLRVERPAGADRLPAIPIRAVAGGATRQESVRLGLEALRETAGWVAVHDVARPFVTGALIDRVLAAARASGAALPAMPLRDTVKEVAEGRVVRSLPRERLYGAQTPQIFARAILARAHEAGRSKAEDRGATDDAALVEALGLPVAVVSGEPSNLKITDPTDLIVARALARSRSGGGM